MSKEIDFRKGASDEALMDFYIRGILDMREHGIEGETWTKDIPTEKLKDMLK